MSEAEKLRASRIKLTLMFLLPILAVGLATLVFYTGFGLVNSTPIALSRAAVAGRRYSPFAGWNTHRNGG